MADCPKCGSQIDEEFGMVTCPGCGTFLFIDMEGIAQIATAEPVGELSSSNIVTSPALSTDPTPPEEHNPFPTFEPVDAPDFEARSEAEPASFDIPGFSFGSEAEDIPPAAEPFSAPEADPAAPAEYSAEPTFEPPTDAADFSMDNFLGLGDSTAPTNTGAENAPTADDPLGLNDFANSEMAAAKDGLLMYRILISGLDTKEIRAAVREALQDSRFAWDAARITAGTSKGSLRIDQVSSVKATILIGRIKRLPIKISWEQYAITGAEMGEPPEESGGY